MNQTLTKLSAFAGMLLIGVTVNAQQAATFVPEPQKEAGNLAPAEKRADNMFGEAQAVQSNVELPGFPVMQNTGNAEQDAADYSKAKAAWIAQNPSQYAAATSNEVVVVKAQKSIADLPGFPVMTNTGDADADYARYKQAKDQWYAENQTLVEDFYRENAKNQPTQKK